MSRTHVVVVAVVAGLAVATALLSGCTATPSPTAPVEEPTPSQTPPPEPRTADDRIDALDAFGMCRSAVSKFVFEAEWQDDFGAFADADIVENDGYFEIGTTGVYVEFEGGDREPASIFCAATGSLGDPRLVYVGIDLGAPGPNGRTGWEQNKAERTAFVTDPGVDTTEVSAPDRPIGPLEAHALCRTLRLSQEPADFVASWPGFDAAAIAEIDEGFLVYEEYDAGIQQNGRTPSNSTCVVGGTVGAPYPALYVSDFGNEGDSRDRWEALRPDIREQLGLPPL